VTLNNGGGGVGGQVSRLLFTIKSREKVVRRALITANKFRINCAVVAILATFFGANKATYRYKSTIRGSTPAKTPLINLNRESESAPNNFLIRATRFL
jgi:hypothetical protein